MLLIYLWTILLTVIALTLEFASSKRLVFALMVVTFLSLLLSIIPRFMKARREADYVLDMAEESGTGPDPWAQADDDPEFDCH